MSETEALTLYRPSVERTPNRGEIRWINNIYYHPALVDVPEKTLVRVAYDMHDANQVWISDLQGQFICIAEWNGNKVDGFAKSFKEKLKDGRIDGMVKRKQEGIADAEAERGTVLEGEVLERIPTIPQEVVEPLKRIVVEGGFNRQEAEETVMTGQEMAVYLAKLMADKK